MNTGAKWGIALGVGIPGALILIGIIGLLVKFFMKRCRKRAWDDISSLPKYVDPFDSSARSRQQKRAASEREPLKPTTTSNNDDASDRHTVIPVDDVEILPGRRPVQSAKPHEHTLVQIQRDRLNHLKEEESRLRPMIRLSDGEDGVQRAIDQAQKEFEASVANASAKMKRRREK